MAVWLSPTLLLRHLLTAVLVLGLTLGLHPGPGARLLAPALPVQPAQAALPNPLGGANTVPPLGVQRVGVLEVSPVTLDGRELFEIASPAVFNRDQPGQQVPVEVRAKQIEVNLNQVITQALNYAEASAEVGEAGAAPADFMTVTIETVNDLPVLFSTVGPLAEPKVLLTVTDSDAQYHGLSEAELAERWAGKLEQSFQGAWASRQPEARRQQGRRLLLILLASLLITLALAGSWQVLGWRKQALVRQQAVESQDRAADPARLPSSPPPLLVLPSATAAASGVLPLADVLGHRLCLDRGAGRQPQPLSPNPALRQQPVYGAGAAASHLVHCQPPQPPGQYWH